MNRSRTTENVLVIGDSWSSAEEGDTGATHAGWPALLNIPESHRQAVEGTTAGDWANEANGGLPRAMSTPAQTIVISLMGNDIIKALADNVIDLDEIEEARAAMRKVVSQFTCLGRHVIVMLYADPFCGRNEQAARAVKIVNEAIRDACRDRTVVFAETFKWLDDNHFTGEDIHPTRDGHRTIAFHLARMIGEVY